jgi:ABC-type uncharacterized transport system fused permease/ATPase subunit
MDRLLPLLAAAPRQFYRLVLVVGASGAGKTATLRALGEHLGVGVVNLGLRLSERLLDVPVRYRPVEVLGLLDDILATSDGDLPVLLDNTEILFELALEQQPLQVLQRLSRNRTVVATWSGVVQGGRLTYAPVGHPARREYAVDNLLLISLPGE